MKGRYLVLLGFIAIVLLSGCGGTSKVYSVGETATDGTFNIKITDWEEMDQLGNYEGPDEGYTYVFVFLDMENISSKDQEFYGTEFEFVVDGYETTQVTFSYGSEEINGIRGFEGILGNDLKPGRKTKNYICAEAPEDWENIEISFRDDINFLISKDS